MEIIRELIQNMLHSSIGGAIGVSAIFIFFFVIVVASIYRINENKKDQH